MSRTKVKQIMKALSLTGVVYGFAGWAYIAMNAVVHPQTLPLPLTHFVGWPREDTFGAVCFVVSAVCFLIYRLLVGE